MKRGLSTADGLSGVGGLILFVSLFLPWSHQLSPALVARFGASSPVLAGIPAAPNAWQVYDTVGWVMLALVLALLSTWANPAWRPRLIRAGAVVLALAFVIHALIDAPTNGLPLASVGTPAHYLADAALSGAGERVALVGLVTALIGLGLGPSPAPARDSGRRRSAQRRPS